MYGDDPTSRQMPVAPICSTSLIRSFAASAAIIVTAPKASRHSLESTTTLRCQAPANDSKIRLPHPLPAGPIVTLFGIVVTPTAALRLISKPRISMRSEADDASLLRSAVKTDHLLQ